MRPPYEQPPPGHALRTLLAALAVHVIGTWWAQVESVLHPGATRLQNCDPDQTQIPPELRLLRVDTDHLVTGAQVVLGLVVQVAELGVAVRVLGALGGRDVGLQAAAAFSQQSADHEITDLVTLSVQRRRRRAPTRRLSSALTAVRPGPGHWRESVPAVLDRS